MKKSIILIILICVLNHLSFAAENLSESTLTNNTYKDEKTDAKLKNTFTDKNIDVGEEKNFVSSKESEAYYYWSEALREAKEGNNLTALHLAKKALEIIPPNQEMLLQTAYFSLAAGRDREATYYFEQAMNFGSLNGKTLIDNAYANRRLGENQKLKLYLEQAIDKETLRLEKLKNPPADDVARLYYARREYADLTRLFGARTNIDYIKAEHSYTNQASQDIYWQPYYENGKLFQIYAQIAGTIAADNNINTGSRTAFGVLGAKWEPIAAYDFFLTYEQVFKIGSATKNDSRVRGGLAWDNGLELNPIRDNWNYTTLFTEYLHSFENSNRIYTLDLRQGRSIKLTESLIFSPHIIFHTDYASETSGMKHWNFSIGPGIHLRQWYREDKYNAYMSNANITLQYRFSTNGGENILLLNFFNSF